MSRRALPARLRAAANAGVFLLKVLPTLPSRPIDRFTGVPVRERVQYPTRNGPVHGDLYRPPAPGPHPGVVVCLGVVPFGVDHPQVGRLGRALARAGLAALLYWSPAMRDLRLDPEDTGDIALAYEYLATRPEIDPARSGLLGTCVGGSFALMAGAHPRIRDRVGFVIAFAPYSSMWTLARDIASGSGPCGGWRVDPLTREVFVRSMTDPLAPAEAALLREDAALAAASLDGLSEDALAVYPLLTTLSRKEAAATLAKLPGPMRDRIEALSPLSCLDGLRARLVIVGHDASDTVIPVGESRRLRAALCGRPGFHYTEFGMFEHADPTKRRLSPPRLARELAKFYLYAYPVFRLAAGG